MLFLGVLIIAPAALTFNRIALPLKTIFRLLHGIITRKNKKKKLLNALKLQQNVIPNKMAPNA